jgi:hypothetical protein
LILAGNLLVNPAPEFPMFLGIKDWRDLTRRDITEDMLGALDLVSHRRTFSRSCEVSKSWEGQPDQNDSALKIRKLTLGQYIEGWTYTSKKYRPLIKCYILPSLGHYRLDELTKDIITRCVNNLKSAKNPTVDLAFGTKGRVLRCLRKILNDAVDSDQSKINPATRVKIIGSEEKLPTP